MLMPLMGAAHAQWHELQPAQIQRMAELLPREPQGLGPRCQDRKAWSDAAVVQRTQAVVAHAESLLKRSYPAWNDDAYLQFNRAGQRGEGERMMNARKAWLYPLIIAECVQAQGRFLPAISNTLRELVQQPSWTWPAHDRDLRSFEKRDFQVDLNGADLAHELSQTLYLLGDWLAPELRAQVLATMRTRIFEPVKKSLTTGRDHTWLRVDHNWNAVCLKGVVGAALAALPDIQERALFAAAGQHYIRYYMAGFPGDGYSTEGPNYWNYGFGHFAMLREQLVQATNAQIDLFKLDKVPAVAQYGLHIEMRPGQVAAFSDTGPRSRPDAFVLAYLNAALNWRLPLSNLQQLPLTPQSPGNAAPLADSMVMLFVKPHMLKNAQPAQAASASSFFADAGVLVSRGQGMAVTMKAGGRGPSGGPGGNGNHSHNDIGSYTIAVGDEQPVGDVGAPRYSAKTFSKDRYSIRAINSWGHPVPVVAGQLQQDASKLHARVLRIDQQSNADLMVIDMKPAYSVSELQTLTRSLRFDRVRLVTHASSTEVSKRPAASAVIEDRFAFTSPQSFETAMTTLGGMKRSGEACVVFTRGAENLSAHISASAPWELLEEKIDEEGLIFTRVALRLKDKAREGFIKVVFEPGLCS
jgi:hypothetical protein